SVLGAGHYCSTIEIQIRYLRPVTDGGLTVETQVVKPGRRIVHLESRVTDANGRLVATATGSYAVLPIPTS
ncbi:MAG: PaaI family thioesterase, partial [Actinomycetota bacterium]